MKSSVEVGGWWCYKVIPFFNTNAHSHDNTARKNGPIWRNWIYFIQKDTVSLTFEHQSLISAFFIPSGIFAKFAEYEFDSLQKLWRLCSEGQNHFLARSLLHLGCSHQNPKSWSSSLSECFRFEESPLGVNKAHTTFCGVTLTFDQKNLNQFIHKSRWMCVARVL